MQSVVSWIAPPQEPNTERQPPVNAEIEQALLGALLINNNAFEYVVDIVKAEEFGFEVHGRLYDAIASLIQSGKPANPVTLKDQFERDPALQRFGGLRYLTQLAQSAITVANAPHYAEQVHDLYLRRAMIALGTEIVERAYVVRSGDSAAQQIEVAEQEIHDLGNLGQGGKKLRSLGDVGDAALEAIQAAFRGDAKPQIDTGLVDLDRILRGCAAGDLVVVAGRTSMAKTDLCASISHYNASLGRVGAYFSLEMSSEELAQRFLARETGISTDRQRNAEIQGDLEWSRLIEANRLIKELPIFFDDQVRVSAAQIRQRLRRLKRRHGLHYAVVDHLQLMRAPNQNMTKFHEIVSENSALLKAIAKDVGIVVIAVSQLSREVERRDDKRPQLADLRESGSIEENADIVMLLFREEYYLERNPPRHRQNQSKEAFSAQLADWEERMSRVRGIAEINVAKNRHGKVGTIKAHFDGETHSFDNLAYDQ